MGNCSVYLVEDKALHDVLFQGRAKIRHRASQANAIIHAGIVHDAVDATVFRQQRGDSGAHGGFIGQLGVEGVGALAFGFELAHKGRGLRAVAAEDASNGALSGEAARDRFTNALGAAGDEGDFVFESEVHREERVGNRGEPGNVETENLETL